jgi:hypothetical protein
VERSGMAWNDIFVADSINFQVNSLAAVIGKYCDYVIGMNGDNAQSSQKSLNWATRQAIRQAFIEGATPDMGSESEKLEEGNSFDPSNHQLADLRSIATVRLSFMTHSCSLALRGLRRLAPGLGSIPSCAKLKGHPGQQVLEDVPGNQVFCQLYD